MWMSVWRVLETHNVLKPIPRRRSAGSSRILFDSMASPRHLALILMLLQQPSLLYADSAPSPLLQQPLAQRLAVGKCDTASDTLFLHSRTTAPPLIHISCFAAGGGVVLLQTRRSRSAAADARSVIGGREAALRGEAGAERLPSSRGPGAAADFPAGAALRAARVADPARTAIWFKLVKASLASAGTAFIKWGQWASVRPDMFPEALRRARRAALAGARAWLQALAEGGRGVV